MRAARLRSIVTGSSRLRICTKKATQAVNIRSTASKDIAALTGVLDGTGLFPSEMLPDMIAGFLTDADNRDIWLTCETDGEIIGFCYAAPEPMTEGTWNMLAIAVLPSRQGNGAGGALVKHLEDNLRSQGHRVLIVDTSGSDAFERAPNFYRGNGYVEEARIRDYWAEGDDKVVFWKAL